MVIEIYSEFNTDLEKHWVDFEKIAVKTPFQSFAWLSHWQKTVGGPLLSVQPQIVLLYDEEQTIAILPLSIRRKFGIKVLEWLGGINTDYMGPLILSKYPYDSENKRIWNDIKSKIGEYDSIHVQKQPEWTVQFLDGIGFSNISYRKLKAYKTSLPHTWDALYNNKSSKTRQTDRRKYRRLEKIGKVNVIIGESEEQTQKIISSLFKQKSRRYRETSEWDMLAVEEYRQFYQGLTNLSSDNIKVHCAALSVGNVMVATHVGIVDKDTFYYLMPANEGGEWVRYSIGRLLLLELIKWSIESGLKYFDFTVGGEAYKKEWSDIENNFYEFIKPISFKGQVYALHQCLKRTILELSWFGSRIKNILNWVRNHI